MTNQQHPDNSAVHLSHCNMGEHVGSCKYGDDDCPALRKAPAQAAPAGEYPLLPEPVGKVEVSTTLENSGLRRHKASPAYTPDQRRAYVDRAMRAEQPATAQQPGDERASHGQAPAGLVVPSMSADEVNALPTAARAYIHQLATNTDPAGMVRENMQLRDTNAGLQSMYRKAADAAQEVVGCFHAAECEGLQAALAGTTDEHLKGLVERRLMHALYAAQEVAGQAPAQAAPAAVAVPSDTFRGDTTCLVQSIIALLELDADGALVPHGIGGHASALLSAAASRLAAAPTTQPAPQQEAQEPVAWYVTGCGRLLDEDEAKAEARHIGGAARAIPLYTAPQADSVTAPAAGAVAGPTSGLHPEKCPITGRPFFMTLDHPELGRIPTYGGPYDSYTIPAPEGEPTDPWHERELRSERYDHDAGWWVEGGEPIPLRIVHEDVLFKLQEDAEAAAAPTPPAQAAESVTAPASGANWQDISTAPKDGTRFVAVGQNYGLDSEKQHTCVAQWLAGCWVEVSDWNGASKLKYLTHWMPLPPLPGSAARAPADSVTASSLASHEKELEDALRERDESDEFIDTLLDEVLGADRAEWSSAYGRADALNDVQERMTTLHKPAVDKAWGRFQVAMATDSVLEDAARLDWLLLHISGAEFRRIGVHYSGNASRADVDTARKQGANHD